MTEQDKKLLLVDLCARLPYGVKVQGNEKYISEIDSIKKKYGIVYLINIDKSLLIEQIKPYLRPMSSMTEEERVEMREFCDSKPRLIYDIGVAGQIHSPNVIDFLNSHHFDYRCLIEKGLALEAPADMHNNKDSERYENTL